VFSRRHRPNDVDRPRRVPLSHRRALVARHTRLRAVPGVPGIRLHLADDAGPVWRATELETGAANAPIPFWAFAWAGGIALARYVLEHPDEVRDRRVLDFATGSGLVAIAAAQSGAADVVAADVDPFAEVAFASNCRANDVIIAFVRDDLLDGPPPDVDVLLAADTWYEGPLAERVLPWLVRAAGQGIRVLVGDPGRRYLPPTGLTPIATYEVETTTALEDRAVVRSRVFTVDGP
jgi:predicted nicotinamide N-methyase